MCQKYLIAEETKTYWEDFRYTINRPTFMLKIFHDFLDLPHCYDQSTCSNFVLHNWNSMFCYGA